MRQLAATKMTFSDENLWYCLKTRPRQEMMAKQRLRSEIGVEVFCPMLRFERARRSGRARVTEAMFPGYIFANFRYALQHRQIASSNGVATIVSFGGLPAVVSSEIIDELRASVSCEETVEIPTVINPGEEVSVIEGPFKGLRAIVTRVVPARARVHILLELLGMEREIEVSEKAVLPDVFHPLVGTA